MAKRWQIKEKKDAQDFDGRRVKGSGNQWHSPGDIRNDTFLVDCKSTTKKSYSVSKSTWDKIYEEALFSQRLPLLSLDIDGLELVVISKEDFLELTKKEDQLLG